MYNIEILQIENSDAEGVSLLFFVPAAGLLPALRPCRQFFPLWIWLLSEALIACLTTLYVGLGACGEQKSVGKYPTPN